MISSAQGFIKFLIKQNLASKFYFAIVTLLYAFVGRNLNCFFCIKNLISSFINTKVITDRNKIDEGSF